MGKITNAPASKRVLKLKARKSELVSIVWRPEWDEATARAELFNAIIKEAGWKIEEYWE